MCKTTTYAIGFGWCWVFASPVHASILYSKVTGSGSGNCSSWADACTLTTALGNATAGDQIWVQGGTYGPISLKNGVKIIGGFSGTETNASQSDPVTNATVIDGGGVRAVSATGVDSSTLLRGFRITNGFDADTNGGGGLHVQDGSPRFVACVFDSNGASFFGGAVAVRGASSPEFFNCTFYSCVAGLAGGAVYVFGNGSPNFTNCLFYGNHAPEGGAIENESGSAKFFNCAMVGNDATIGGGGAVDDDQGDVEIYNSILWQNTAAHGNPHISNGRDGVTKVRYSDVGGGRPGTGNIDADPLFVDVDGLDDIPGTDDDDLRLQPGSPCIDAADNTVVPADRADLDGDGDTTERTPLDLDGNVRFVDDRATADSGNGTPMIVDMGAYEFQVCDGNGVVGIGEECDDGNSFNGDGCDNNCTLTACGNGIQTAGEECDDGNVQPGDGCDATCHIEPEVADCNGNGVPDHQDIADGSSDDCNFDGRPDECILINDLEDAKLTASDAWQNDQFGLSVSISGDTAVVGAVSDDCAAGVDCGAAYVYRFDGTNWIEQQKLTASDAWQSDSFGFSVSISGDTAVVGAPGDDDCGGAGGNCGAAYVYRFNGTNWIEQSKLTASDAASSDQFGHSVSISGDTAVVGARLDDCAAGFHCGAAYVYRFDGTNWIEQPKLTASDAEPFDRFGSSVSISGDTAFVGAPDDDDCAAGDRCGTAYVYRFDGTNWIEQQKLTASDAGQSDQFGFSVSISGDTAVVGAPGDGDCVVGVGFGCGAAYVYRFDGTSWIEHQKLAASDAAPSGAFGVSVSISGDTVVAGAWLTRCAAGANCGAAYVYRFNGTGWIEEQKLAATDAAQLDLFGRSVSISGDTTVVGAFATDCAPNSDCGAAYVYTLVDQNLNEDCNLNGIGDLCDLTEGTSSDCNSNDTPDECDIARGVSDDCNINDSPDECDIANGVSGDCNNNSVPDDCDVDLNDPDGNGFVSADCNYNEIPDECEPDCNSNNTADSCDIAAGASLDCNDNGTPDECESGCETDTAEAIGQDETVTLNPGGGSTDLKEEAQVAFTNQSGAGGVTVTVVETIDPVHSDAFGLETLAATLLIDTSLSDGEFFMTVIVPFGAADLGGTNPLNMGLVSYDANSASWIPAVCGNTTPSSICPATPFSTRRVEQAPDDPEPTLVDLSVRNLGEHGVYWNGAEGFAWANVDHTTAFSLGSVFIATSPLEAADDGLGGDYNRVGDFKMPTSGVVGLEVAIRVTLNRMYIDSGEDLANGCPVRQGLPDLQAFEGQVRYLGPPEIFNNNNLSQPKWVAAKLQCVPFYRDWSASALAADLGITDAEAATIFYYGAEVVPCSIHAVQQATQSCVDSANEDCFSEPLEVRTAEWGDIWPIPGGFGANVNFGDIGNQVDAFKAIPFVLGDPPSGGANRWRSMVRDNEGAPGGSVNFNSIGKVVRAFQTIAYGEGGPDHCP